VVVDLNEALLMTRENNEQGVILLQKPNERRHPDGVSVV